MTFKVIIYDNKSKQRVFFFIYLIRGVDDQQCVDDRISHTKFSFHCFDSEERLGDLFEGQMSN